MGINVYEVFKFKNQLLCNFTIGEQLMQNFLYKNRCLCKLLYLIVFENFKTIIKHILSF